MKQFLEKMKSVAKDIADERGDLSLFAIFLREDVDKWDVVVAAPWLSTDNMEDYKYVADKIKQYLVVNELLSISRIVLLGLHDSIVQIVNNYCSVKPGGSLELHDLYSMELPFIKHAYILASQGGKPVSVNVGKRNLRQPRQSI